MEQSVPVAALAAIVGEEHVRTDAPSRNAASAGWYPLETKQKQAGGGAPRNVVAAVVLPATAAEVAAVVRWANETRTPLVPVGGSSNTVGSTMPERGGVAVDLARLQDLQWDEDSLLVHAGAGWGLGALEEKLNGHGYTLGHLPQSLHLATVGGSIATDAVGILAGKYGRQRDLTLALEAVLPTGELFRSPLRPERGGGFDIASLFFGSEGALGIVTAATMRVHPLPDVRAWAAFTFETFGGGIEALGTIYRTDTRPATARLLDPVAASELLSAHSLPSGAALLLLAFEGDELIQTGHYQMAHAICAKLGGSEQLSEIGEAWFEDRHATTWMAANGRADGLADSFSCAGPWGRITDIYKGVRAAIEPLVVAVSGQISHAYAGGAALDVVFRAEASGGGPDAAESLYRQIVRAATDACLSSGGTIAHHYGVGVARREGFLTQLGEGGALALRQIKRALDPNDIMNPGMLGTEIPDSQTP